MKRPFLLTTAWILVLSVLLMTGCLSARLPEESGEPSSVKPTETKMEKTDAPSDPARETPAETTASLPTETLPGETTGSALSETGLPHETEPYETAPPETSPPEPEIPEGMRIFFGRLMDENIAAVNARTLEAEGSGLYDVLSAHTWLNEEVLALINTYSLPERTFYGARAVTPELREEILANRNIGYLSDFPGTEVPLRCGIISENASVRSFPTSMRACDSLDGKAFDYFQESMFQIGEGVLVLHESLDGQWAFVQGSNYFGWVHEENIAFTSEEEFRSFLTGKDFAVAVRPGIRVSKTLPAGDLYERTLRLGTILPVKEFREDAVTLVFPLRNGVGELEREDVVLANNGAFSAGFVPYSADQLISVARGMLGQEYGWGDERGNYDCSSFTGLVYRCFGIFNPRNSSQQRYSGATVKDFFGLSMADKTAAFEAAPGAVLVMSGHVMLYEGVVDGRHMVLHANTFYVDADGVTHEVQKVAEAPIEDLHRTNGTSFTEAIQLMVCYP